MNLTLLEWDRSWRAKPFFIPRFVVVYMTPIDDPDPHTDRGIYQVMLLDDTGRATGWVERFFTLRALAAYLGHGPSEIVGEVTP